MTVYPSGTGSTSFFICYHLLTDERFSSAGQQRLQRRDKPFRPGTTVYWAQEALRYRGQAVHIDQLVEDVYRLSGTKVEKSSLVGNLSRYVRQGVVFNRHGEAQYGLIEFQEEPHPTHVA